MKNSVIRTRGKILTYLSKCSYPVSPYTIATDLSMNQSTVRARLTELLREGKIVRTYRGHYQSKPIHGVGEGLPKVGNLVLFFEPYLFEKKIPDYNESFCDSRLKIQYGLKRKRVTWYVSNDKGLDLNGLRLALEILRLAMGLALGDLIDLSELRISTLEFMTDYHNARWDRKPCITVTSFLGALERIYQKKDVLRSEVKTKMNSVEDVYMLLKGGVVPYNLVQIQIMILQKQDAITHQNQIIINNMVSILRYMRELLSRINVNHKKSLIKPREKQEALVHIIYSDHVLFRNTNPALFKPVIRETIGWLVKEDNEALYVVFDKSVEILPFEKFDLSSGIIILKSNIIEVDEIE